MLLQTILLKRKWPLLKVIRLTNVGGYYTRDGEDLLLSSLFHSHFIKNPSSHIVEIDKPERFVFSSVTALVLLFNCIATLVNTDLSKSLLVSNRVDSITEQSAVAIDNCQIFGFDSISTHELKLETYIDNIKLVEEIVDSSLAGVHVVTTIAPEAMRLLECLLLTGKVFSVVLLDNNEGLFNYGNDNFRRKLESHGLIYYARLNGQSDYFVLSDLINGFPGRLLNKLGMSALARRISTPLESDYLRPR